MLIDRHVAQERQAFFVIAHHDRVGFGVAPGEIGTLYRGAGGRAADDATPPE